MVIRYLILIASLLVLSSVYLVFSQDGTAQSAHDLFLSGPRYSDVQGSQVATIEFGGPLGFNYSPKEIRISPGDSVEWLGDFAMHPLVSDDGLWQTINTSTDFSFTYNQPGTYPYHCSIHNFSGMNGTVTVGYYGYLPLITR